MVSCRVSVKNPPESGFVVIGTMLVCTPLKPEHTHHGAVVDRMFWVTQSQCLPGVATPNAQGMAIIGFIKIWQAMLVKQCHKRPI